MAYGNIVLASSKKGFIPNSIKWFTKSQFSHSLVTMPEILQIQMCIEAAEGGVDFTRFDKGYQNDPNQGFQVWNIKVDQSIKNKALISILNDLEIGYGFFEYIYFIARKAFSVFGKDIKSWNNWFRKDGMIYSQLCVAYIRACGLQKVLSEFGKGSIAPQDLQDIMKANPELFELTDSIRL